MSKRDDDELLAYIAHGIRMMGTALESALEGNRRSWIYDDYWYRRRRPKTATPPAGPPERIVPLIERIDRAAGEHATAYETLLTAEEVAEFLELERISVRNLATCRHLDSVKVGNQLLIKFGELRRYLEEGPGQSAHSRLEWRPLIEEFPGRRKAEEAEARTEVLRQKYDAVTVRDLRDLLELDWEDIDRLERKKVIEPLRIPEPNSWRMVKKADIPKIEAWLREEEERKARKRAERTAQRKEPRIKL